MHYVLFHILNGDPTINGLQSASPVCCKLHVCAWTSSLIIISILKLYCIFYLFVCSTQAKGFHSCLIDTPLLSPLSFCILKNKYLYNHYCRLKHGDYLTIVEIMRTVILYPGLYSCICMVQLTQYTSHTVGT